MIKSNNDMLFYLLNMHKDKHINYKDQDTTKYIFEINKVRLYFFFIDFHF